AVVTVPTEPALARLAAAKVAEDIVGAALLAGGIEDHALEPLAVELGLSTEDGIVDHQGFEWQLLFDDPAARIGHPADVPGALEQSEGGLHAHAVDSPRERL